MTELKKNEPTLVPGAMLDPAELRESAKKTARKVILKVLTYVPAAIIFGLIALYYIQLSHMA